MAKHKNSIQSGQPLKHTCGVCGKAMGPLAMLPNVPGMNPRCSICKQEVCAAHFNVMQSACTRCASKSTDWCKTPGL